MKHSRTVSALSARRFDRVFFLDDFFRSAANGLASHPTNRRFLRKLFESSLARLGLRCDEVFARSDGGSIDVGMAMDDLQLPRSQEGWAAAVIADLTSLRPATGLPCLDRRSLVIGWGMTPAMLCWIDRCGGTFIDLEIDPIRFTKHLKFCARTNDPAIKCLLGRLRLEEEECWSDAAALKGYFARRGASFLLEEDLRIGLFIGQTALDLALVEKGRLMRPEDVRERVHELARDVDILLVRSHPYEASFAHLSAMTEGIPNVAWTQLNIYALLCAENLQSVFGLSSGALREAGYFLKPVEALISADRNNPQALPAGCSDWIPVSAELASIESMESICRPLARWRQALGAWRSGAEAPSASRHFRGDALDYAFGVRWGLDAAQTGLPLIPSLQADQSHVFSSGSSATNWLGGGWSSPESWGVWTERERASLIVPLDEALWSKDIEIRLDGHSFSAPNVVSPSIFARLGGDHSDWVQLAGETESLHVVLSATPRGLVPQRLIMIEIAIRTPVRPSEHGLGADGRALGFALCRLQASIGGPTAAG